jgi:protein AATF/BFR2
LSSNESIQPPPVKRRKVDETSSLQDYGTWVQEATEGVSSLEHWYVFWLLELLALLSFSFHPHLTQTLAKWSAKVQAVSPAVLLPSNRGSFASKGKQKPKSVLQVIDETLLDHGKLLARTRIRKSKDQILRLTGEVESEEVEGDKMDSEVFDDLDFYQQMLRDVIESKGNAFRGEDWMAVQKQKKLKKKVDTRASKGRKIR